MSRLDDEQDAGPPLPNLSGGQYINLGTVAPSYGISNKNSQPDYLDYDHKGRGVVVTMFANTGASYLAATAFGGVYGLKQGLSNTPSSRFKVKLNSVLNNCGRYGSRAGNTAGSLAVLYSLYEGAADGLDIDSYMPGNLAVSVSPFIASFCTGATFKATAGPRVAALAGTIGLGCVGVTYIGYGLLGIPYGSRGFLFF